MPAYVQSTFQGRTSVPRHEMPVRLYQGALSRVGEKRAFPVCELRLDQPGAFQEAIIANVAGKVRLKINQKAENRLFGASKANECSFMPAL